LNQIAFRGNACFDSAYSGLGHERRIRAVATILLNPESRHRSGHRFVTRWAIPDIRWPDSGILRPPRAGFRRGLHLSDRGDTTRWMS
jgi:hypothetical protein